MTAGRELIPAIMALDDERDELARRAEALAYAGQVLRKLAGVDGARSKTLPPPGALPRPSDSEPTHAVERARKRRKPQVKPQGEPRTDAADIARPRGKKAKLAERVFEALASLGRPASIADVMAAANGGTRLSVRFALGELKRAGRVSASGANQQRLYSLASSRLPDRPTPSVGSLSDGPGDEKEGRVGKREDSRDGRREDEEEVPPARPAKRGMGVLALLAAEWLRDQNVKVLKLPPRAGKFGRGGHREWLIDGQPLNAARVVERANRMRAELGQPEFA